MPTTPTAPRPVRRGMNRRFAPGKRIGPTPGRLVPVEAPAGCREIGLVQHVLGGEPGLDREACVVGQKQDDTHLQHQGDLVRGRPQQVVERGDAGELAAE